MDTDDAAPGRKEPDEPPSAHEQDVLREIPGREMDPTLMRNQAALRHSAGTVWVVIGALFTVVALVVFLPALPLQPTIAWIGVLAVMVLFSAMLLTRYAVADHRRRLLTLAALLIAIAAVSLVCVLLIGIREWGLVAG